MKKIVSVLFGLAVAFSVTLIAYAESYNGNVKAKYVSDMNSGTIYEKDSNIQIVIEPITSSDTDAYKYVLSLLSDEQSFACGYHIAFYDERGDKVTPEKDVIIKLPFKENSENIKLYYIDDDGGIYETGFNGSYSIAEFQTSKGGYYVFARPAEIKNDDHSSFPEKADHNNQSGTVVDLSPDTGTVGEFSIAFIAAAAAITVVKRRSDRK